MRIGIGAYELLLGCSHKHKVRSLYVCRYNVNYLGNRSETRAVLFDGYIGVMVDY